MDQVSGIDRKKVEMVIERILTLKGELSSLREEVQEGRRLMEGEESARHSLEAELEKLRSASRGGNGSSKPPSAELVKRLLGMIPDKVAGILRRKGAARIPGIGTFTVRLGPEGRIIDFEPDEMLRRNL